MEKVGSSGVITIEESKTAETYSEVVEGMQFDRGYITPYMVTDTDKMEAVIDDAYLLITDKKISNHPGDPADARADREGRQEARHHRRGRRGRRAGHPACQQVCAATSPASASRPPASATAARKCSRISPF
jgi:hypothetical protein